MTAKVRLRLAPDLALPAEAVTETFGILGKRGSGKTNTSVVLTEQMIGARLPVCVVDPVGVWWGLRHDKSGKGPGLPIVILGGEHGDLPLEETGGAVLADFLVEHRAPMVLDLKHLSKSATRRFMVDFAERLYRQNKDALHLVLDEADTFCPQRTEHGAERLVGAINDLVRRGRARGLGVTLISQRPALVNKDVLTQIEVLIALRMTGPQDRDAIERWVEHNADDVQAKDVLSSLSSLGRGEAWVWSPGWLGLFKRVQVDERTTFDSSATPKAGTTRLAVPKGAAEVDLGALREKLAATIERAAAEDPRRLKARVAELEREVLAAQTRRAPEPKRVEVPVLTGAQLAALHSYVRQLEKVTADVGGVRDALLGAASTLAAAPPPPARAPGLSRTNGKKEGAVACTIPYETRLEASEAEPAGSGAFDRAMRSEIRARAQLQALTPAMPSLDPDLKLGKGDRQTLVAIAEHVHGVVREQLSVLTGYKRSSRDTFLQRLSAQGLVKGAARGPFLVTPKGLRELGPDFRPLPASGRALRDLWLARLTGGERRIFEVLVESPRALSREELGEVTGYKRSSRDTYLQRLRARELVVEEHGALRPAAALRD